MIPREAFAQLCDGITGAANALEETRTVAMNAFMIDLLVKADFALEWEGPQPYGKRVTAL
jgi:hypothetical protein